MTKDWNKIFAETINDFDCDLLKSKDGNYIFDDVLLDKQTELCKNNNDAVHIIESLVENYWENYVLDGDSICYKIDENDLPETARGCGFNNLKEVVDWYTPEMKAKYPLKEEYVDMCECFLNHLDEINLDKVYFYMHENKAKKDIKWKNYENLVADELGYTRSIELLSEAGFSKEYIKALDGYSGINVDEILNEDCLEEG